MGRHEGKIYLNDGNELTGVIRYDDKNRILSYQSGEESKSFTSRNINGFEFWDDTNQKQRVFYTLLYPDSQDDIVKPLFFEVIAKFDSFSLLSKIDLPKIKVRTYYSQPTNIPSNGTYMGTATNITQTETVYIMDAEDDRIEPYCRAVTSFNSKKMKQEHTMLNEDLLRKKVGSKYAELKQYAKENKLMFNRKEDLITILNYYF